MLAASAFLPFLPMASIHLILLNLIYDISCTAMSWDNVDADYLRIPRKWDASGISRFMLWIGPTSSVFDIAAYLLMYFVLCPALTGGHLYTQLTDPAAQALYVALFQSGWFVESMWSQTPGHPYAPHAQAPLCAQPRLRAGHAAHLLRESASSRESPLLPWERHWASRPFPGVFPMAGRVCPGVYAPGHRYEKGLYPPVRQLL